MTNRLKAGDTVVWCDEHIAYILEENVLVADPISIEDAERLRLAGDELPFSIGIKIMLVDTEEIFDVHSDSVTKTGAAFVNRQIECNVPLRCL